MNDYKELIEYIQGGAAFRHIISECGADDKMWFDKRFICDYVSRLKYAIEQLVKERDAAIHDLDMAVCGQESYPCGYCANYGIKPIGVEDVCETCTDCGKWEWRGVQNADS